MPELTGNGGEWSEPYVLLRIMGDGELKLTDENEEELAGYYLDIIGALRVENSDRRVRYVNLEERDGYRVIAILINEIPTTTSRSDEMSQMADTLRDYILNKPAKRAFPVTDEIENYLSDIEVKTVTAVSVDKSDIFITASDPRSGLVRKDIGYSIKSDLAKKPTLFNTGHGSRIVYRLNGDLTDALIEQVNSLMTPKGKTDVVGRWRLLDENGIEREFANFAYSRTKKCHPMTETFDLMNPHMVKMFESMVRAKFDGCLSGYSLVDINQWLIETNPCGLTRPEVKYEYMLKQFLYASYCGTTAGTPWDGKSNVNGGMITVKADGAVVAFNSLDGEVFKNYLFHHTKLENPGTDQGHGFYGFIYWNELYEAYCFDLNWQIRYSHF